MGSCYSCKSNGGRPPTYTTVAMTTNEAASVTAKDGRRPPYSRGSSTSSSFGFRKRTPATLKSQTQDRTSELVNIYETKIASGKPKPNASPAALRRLASNQAPSHRPASPHSSNPSIANNVHHRPQPGFSFHKSGPRGLTATLATKTADTNCNETRATGQITSGATNKANLVSGSPKRPLGSATSLKGVPKPGGYRYIEDYENGNHHHLHQHRAHDERVAGDERPAVETCPRPAIKVKTLQSSLPKPQLPIMLSKSAAGRRGMAPEPMDISAETLVTVADDDSTVYDADSGLGNSVSEQRRSDGDTETLAEVDQIEGDTASVSSRHHQMAPLSVVVGDEVHVDPKRVVGEQQRSTKVSGIGRFRSALPTARTTKQCRSSPVLQPRNPRNAVASAVPAPKKKVVTAGSPKKIVAQKGTGLRIGGGQQPKDFGSEEWKIVNEIRQKENVTPDVLSDDGGGSLAVPVPVVVHAKPEAMSLTILHREPRPGGARQASVEAPSVMTTSDDSTESSSLRNAGPYSPPSEKDFFLIDDEICDQPALIACQSLDTDAYRNGLAHSQRDLALLNELMMNSSLTDALDEGMTNSVNQRSCNIASQRRPSHSLNTLSPTSSINSDDLMCDYDCTEETFADGFGNRTSTDIFDEGVQMDCIDSDARFHQTTRTIQQRSPAVGSILEEWNGLKGSHGFDGRSSSGQKPKHRSQRLDFIDTLSPHVHSAESSSSSCSSTDMPAAAPAAVTASGTSTSTAGRRTGISFRPPKQMNVTDSGDGCAKVDASSYRYMCQDLTSMKTMLLKLKRSLQESDDIPADTLNPFEMSNYKNRLFLNLANSDPPDSILPDRNLDHVTDQPAAGLIEQENADLRRQVIFFQEQLEERDRTIKLLQQQLAKLTIPSDDLVSTEKYDAACQTERQRSVLGNSLPLTDDDNSFGSTVSLRSRK